MNKINLEKIKKLRKEYDISQEKMAEIIGCNSVYPYNRKETGKQPFKADEIYVIANYFDVKVEYFFENKFAENEKVNTA